MTREYPFDFHVTGSIPDSEDDESHETYVSRSLLAAATQGWIHDPVFKPYYHDTGYVIAADSEAAIAQIDARRERPQNSDIISLTSPEDFRNTMPEGILTGDFPGWQGFFKKTGAGWVHARNAMVSAATEAKRLGVAFITGSPEGTVIGLIHEGEDVSGARTADGKEHKACRTILCAGANSNQLLDLEDQLRPTAWTLAHIKMTDEEVKLYKNLPVLFNIEKGFFMEPDEEKHELKICDEHPGYCNWVRDPAGKLISLPFARHQVPREAEQRVRSFLRETMPQLAERPFSFARICWCADTPDRAFLIDYHPKYASLVLGVGGSGHGFKYVPSVGGYIADRMEGKLDERLARAFRWRPETAVDRDWKDMQGRFGGPNKLMDFQKVEGWTEIDI